MATHTIPSGSQSVWYGTSTNPPPAETLINNSVITTNPALSETDAGSEVADDAITLYETNGLTLINTGTINSTYSGTSNQGYGVLFIGTLTQQVTVTNTATGVIEDSGGSGIGVFLYSGTVINDGFISGGPGSTPYTGVGVSIGDNGGVISNASTGTIAGGGIYGFGWTTVVNAGKVQGQAASGSQYGAVYLKAGGIITNLSSGTILGDNGTYGIKIANAAGTVINAGYIANGSSGGDAVTLTDGFTNLVEVDPGARFKGVVDGGTAADAPWNSASGAARAR